MMEKPFSMVHVSIRPFFFFFRFWFSHDFRFNMYVVNQTCQDVEPKQWARVLKSKRRKQSFDIFNGVVERHKKATRDRFQI